MDRMTRVSQAALILMGGFAFFAALDIMESIAAPLTIAMVVGIVLSPVFDRLVSAGLNKTLAALATLLLTLLCLGSLMLVFQPLVSRLVAEAPKVWTDMQDTINYLRDMVRGITTATADMAEAITDQNGAAAASGTAAAPDKGMGLPSVTDALWLAPAILGQALIFAGSLFFFLLSRNEIYDWASIRLSGPTERARTSIKLREAERQVSRYFLTITVINAGLGTLTAIVLQTIGLPGAALWGVVAFLLNFILYLGPAVFAVSLVFAGIAAFDGWYSALPAMLYVMLNTTEGQFVTPALVGRNMAVNPLLVFVALVFGIWLWGPIGGIVAIPLLLWILVLNDALKQPSAAA